MNATFKQVAPTGLVALMALGCCWPYLTGSAASKLDSEKPLEWSVNGWPTTEQVSSSGRDPFQLAAPVVESGPSEETVAAAANSRSLLDGLVLNATSLAGRKRAAIISGAFYEEGQRLDLGEAGGEYVVAQIGRDRVVIRGPGNAVVLRYTAPHKPNTSQEPAE